MEVLSTEKKTSFFLGATAMFNPWSSKCEVTVGPIDPTNELRFTPDQFLRYIDKVRSNKIKNARLVERSGNFLIENTRFNYFDGLNQIGLACGEYTDFTVLQNLKRYILEPDEGYIVNNGNPSNHTGGGLEIASGMTGSNRSSVCRDSICMPPPPPPPPAPSASSKLAISQLVDHAKVHDRVNSNSNFNNDNNSNNGNSGDCAASFASTASTAVATATAAAAAAAAASSGSGVHSDLFRRQIPRESLTRLLDMPIFHGTNVKNVVQSGKSLLYYLMTYLLANCMRMYVLPGPRLPCFSAILPLHALCTIFDFNINALPRRCLLPIHRTRYAYLASSLNVKYMFVFPPNVSFLDRRDPVIHDGGIDTCDKLFLVDDERSDFRINCTLNCKNRNEDYDGDTNNPGFCKGIESHTEIKYNMRTNLMPLLRNRHIVSQNILYRLFVILYADPPYDHTYRLIVRDRTKSVEQDLYENVVKVLHGINILDNKQARQRALRFFGPDNYLLYEMFARRNLEQALTHIRELEHALARFDRGETADMPSQSRVIGVAVNVEHMSRDSDTRNELYVNSLHKLDRVWRHSEFSKTGNCFSIIDNMIRSMVLIQSDAAATDFLNDLMRRVHDKFPEVFTGEEPMCFTNIVNVLSLAKGNFDDILMLQRTFETKLAQPNDFAVSRCMMDLLTPVSESKLKQNKQYLDNFVYGSKKVPKNSKLAISTKWTLQNVIYYEGSLYIDEREVLSDCLRVFSYELFMDVDLVCTIFDSILLDMVL